MSKNKKIAVVTIGCVIVATIILSVLTMSGKNPVSDISNTVFTPVLSVAKGVGKPFDNFFGYFKNVKKLTEENERLKSELETLKKESRNQEEYKKENARLKNLLNLSEEMSSFDIVAAKVVAYEPENWFYRLTINKGTKHGVNVSDVVITDMGLVGKVIEAGYNWSKISTVLDSGNSVGIRLYRTGDFGISEGDATLLKKRRFKLNYLSKETALIKGDLIETSGLGGIYPPGISVGRVEDVEFENTGELTKAIIEPSVNLEEVYEVLVITSWDDSPNTTFLQGEE